MMRHLASKPVIASHRQAIAKLGIALCNKSCCLKTDPGVRNDMLITIHQTMSFEFGDSASDDVGEILFKTLEDESAQ